MGARPIAGEPRRLSIKVSDARAKRALIRLCTGAAAARAAQLARVPAQTRRQHACVFVTVDTIWLRQL
jgi:hypothetical protein